MEIFPCFLPWGSFVNVGSSHVMEMFQRQWVYPCLLILPKERSGLFLGLLGGDLVSHWNWLKSVFAYPGAGATSDKVEASGCVTTAQPPEGLRMVVSRLGSQSVLADGAPVKNPGRPGPEELPGWQYCQILFPRDAGSVCSFTGIRQLKVPTGTFSDAVLCVSTLVWFKTVVFTVINHNRK